MPLGGDFSCFFFFLTVGFSVFLLLISFVPFNCLFFPNSLQDPQVFVPSGGHLCFYVCALDLFSSSSLHHAIFLIFLALLNFFS